MTTADPFHTRMAGLIADVRVSAAFLTRVPVRWLGGDVAGRPDLGEASRVFPLVGAAIGFAGGLVLVIAALLGVPLFIAASLAVATTMLTTGALHEDGLADTFDGLGGGATPERKLEIMRDSRIGAYGASALVFSILIRTGTLWSLAIASPWRAGLALIAAEAVSRTALMRVWHDLPAARPLGLAHDTGPPEAESLLMAQALALVIALATVWPTAGLAAAIVGILLAVAGTYIFIVVSRAQIGGRTGDTLGACQQIAAVSFLVGVASAA
jgi:adenosylcobinamide-GDP ribazoletransferase